MNLLCPVESAQTLNNDQINNHLNLSTKILSSAILHNISILENIKELEIVPSSPKQNWASKCRKNYIWVLEHYIALCDVYKDINGEPHVYDTEGYRAAYEDALVHIPGGELK